MPLKKRLFAFAVSILFLLIDTSVSYTHLTLPTIA